MNGRRGGPTQAIALSVPAALPGVFAGPARPPDPQ